MQAIAATAEYESSRSEERMAEDCLIALGEGNRAALEELYSIASPHVYSYALSVLRSVQDAEDVLHDCFVSIFTSAGGYEPRGKPFAWIITIAKNLCFMRLRERKRLSDGAAIDEDHDMAFAQSEGMDPEDRLMIRSCMTLLTEEENRIVVLHAVSGFKHREIAEILELPLMTVISKYRRALAKLRENIEPKGGKGQ